MTGICFCLRLGGIGYTPPSRPKMPTVYACSLKHLAIAQRNYGKDDAMAEIETKARKEAGRVAATYLNDVVKQTDIGQLDGDTWDIFLQAIIETYKAEIGRMSEAPF